MISLPGGSHGPTRKSISSRAMWDVGLVPRMPSIAIWKQFQNKEIKPNKEKQNQTDMKIKPKIYIILMRNLMKKKAEEKLTLNPFGLGCTDAVPNRHIFPWFPVFLKMLTDPVLSSALSCRVPAPWPCMWYQNVAHSPKDVDGKRPVYITARWVLVPLVGSKYMM